MSSIKMYLILTYYYLRFMLIKFFSKISLPISLISGLLGMGLIGWYIIEKNKMNKKNKKNRAHKISLAPKCYKNFDAQISDVRITNMCGTDLWIEARYDLGDGYGSRPIKGDKTAYKIKSGEHVDFDISEKGLVGARFWAKYGCNEEGKNCIIGDSSQYLGGGCPEKGCHIPVDSLFEATFGCSLSDKSQCNINPADQKPLSNETHFDTSQVDGFTLPYIVKIKGDSSELAKCFFQDPKNKDNPNPTIDGSGLDVKKCPTDEDFSYVIKDEHGNDKRITTVKDGDNVHDLTRVNLQLLNDDKTKIIGCISPCKKLNYPSNNNGFGQSESNRPGIWYCCPTPVSNPNEDNCTIDGNPPCMTSEACRKGPVVNSKYVQLLKRVAPYIYTFAYDDFAALNKCPAKTVKYEVIFCPPGTEYPKNV